MRVLFLSPLRLLQSSRFCLFGIVIGLTALHLLLTWRMADDIDRLIIDMLFWGGLLCFLWRKRNILNLESDIFSSFIGFLLIALVLLKSITLFGFESFFETRTLVNSSRFMSTGIRNQGNKAILARVSVRATCMPTY